ncbi:MAG: DNA cytosine methyltransferase [Microscillaceae bacterium]|jgi:DNA (cytosine-5)-methyltransferase 1|nr:DNA cytosine methyltransferase [Microscillaceae bacterium]
MLNYIDLFSGCGGLALGLHFAGWKGLFAIEKEKNAFETLKYNLIENKNHFSWVDWLPKGNLDIDDILKKYETELKSLAGSVDLVAGGPPCQGFSMAGQRIENDSRNKLVYSYIQFIELIKPKVLFFENVKGFTQNFKNGDSKIPYSQIVVQKLKSLEYDVEGHIIDCSEYGIPQKRKRFILVGFLKKSGINPNLFFELLKTQKVDFLRQKGINEKTSVKEAISDLLEANGKKHCPDGGKFFSGVYNGVETSYQDLLRSKKNKIKKIVDSHRFANHRKETIELFKNLLANAPRNKRLDGNYKKQYNIKKRGITVLDKDSPAPTLTSHPDDYLHYAEPRILTVREYARIQSFPDWFEFKGKYTTGGKLRKLEAPRYTQVGNAIPPLFSELVGLVLKHILNYD